MTEFDDDFDPALSALLRRALHQQVDPETSKRHLEIIKTEAARLQAERAATPVWPRRQLLVAALVGLLLMVMSGGAVAASGAALPGDLLYPVKLGTEQVRLLIAISPDADSAVLLDIARRRIAEAQEAMHRQPESVNKLVQEAMQAIDAADTERDPVLQRTAMTLRDQASRTVALTDDLDPDQADALQTPTPRVTVPPSASSSSDPTVALPPDAEPPTSSGSPPGGSTSSPPPAGVVPPETSTAGVAPPPKPSTSTQSATTSSSASLEPEASSSSTAP